MAVVTVSARKRFADRYANERKTLNLEASQFRIRELSTHWNGLKYVEAKDLGPVLLLEQTAWPTEDLTAVQQAKLKPRLIQAMGYLQNPELSTYGALKTNGLRWEFSLRSSLTNEYGAALGEVRQPGEVLTKLWQTMAPPMPAQPRPRLTAICLTNLVVATSQTNSRSTIVNGPTRKGLTVLRVAPEPGFNYAPKHTVTEGGGPDELYAHISFYARSNTSTNAGPVYLSLAWSEPDQEWVLGRLMADVLLKFEVPF